MSRKKCIASSAFRDLLSPETRASLEEWESQRQKEKEEILTKIKSSKKVGSLNGPES